MNILNPLKSQWIIGPIVIISYVSCLYIIYNITLFLTFKLLQFSPVCSVILTVWPTHCYDAERVLVSQSGYEKIDPIYLSSPPLADLPVTSCVKPQWQLWPRLHVIFQPSSVIQPLGLNVDLGRSCRDYFTGGNSINQSWVLWFETEKHRWGEDLIFLE